MCVYKSLDIHLIINFFIQQNNICFICFICFIFKHDKTILRNTHTHTHIYNDNKVDWLDINYLFSYNDKSYFPNNCIHVLSHWGRFILKPKNLAILVSRYLTLEKPTHMVLWNPPPHPTKSKVLVHITTTSEQDWIEWKELHTGNLIEHQKTGISQN